jgi:hypothetical protein
MPSLEALVLDGDRRQVGEGGRYETEAGRFDLFSDGRVYLRVEYQVQAMKPRKGKCAGFAKNTISKICPIPLKA